MAKSRADLLSARNRRYVECQGYRLQSLTDLEWSDWESKRINHKKGEINVAEVKASRRRLLVKVLVDDAGARLFTDEEANELEALDAKLTGELYDAAFKHCGYDKADEEIEDDEKNS